MDRPVLLIVDDDANLRKTLAGIMEMKGYGVLSAADGKTGLAVLEENRVNLALIDLGLPDILGVDLLKKIKELYPSTQAIILTGNATLDSAIEATNRGAFSYLRKPFDIDQLLLLVQRAIEKQQMEEKMQLLTEMAADAITMIDHEGSILYWNPAAERIFGYTVEEAMGHQIHRLIAPEHLRDAYLREMLKDRSSGRMPPSHSTIELEALRKDGGLIPVEVSFSSTLLHKERHFIGIIRDVSERKKAEEERKILEQQLRQSQKMEAIGQLAGGIAHDFNNILMSIIGFSELMKIKLKSDDPLQSNIDHILMASDRAAYLTRSVLAYSRKQIMHRKSTDLNEILRNWIALLRTVLNEDVDLQLKLSETPLNIMADSQQIEQVLMNLATNARDAMPSGGSLVIETGHFDMDNQFLADHGYGFPGSYALFRLTDSGIGMDGQTKNHIFEPFFTTKEVGKGTGLGLSVAYGIVKQHDGYIDCVSAPGKGSTFSVYLPIINETAREKRNSQSTPMPLGSETILLAEDDEEARCLSRGYLEQFGYRVIEAANGEEAIAQFHIHKDEISLMLLDMIMPRLNGKEVFNQVRQVRPDIKVIFMSGYTNDVLQRDDIEATGAEVLLKPTAFKELLATIRKSLEPKGRWSSTLN
jgi:PAS domain S-box-containing protein